LSRGQVIYPATPDSTTVAKEPGTNDVLLLLVRVVALYQ
jgi:hypothetical protein